jgi:hypothetical protein
VTVRVVDGGVEVKLHDTGTVVPRATALKVQFAAEIVCLPAAFGVHVPLSVMDFVAPLATPPRSPADSATGVALGIENVLRSVMLTPVLLVKVEDSLIGTLSPTWITVGTVKVKVDGPASVMPRAVQLVGVEVASAWATEDIIATPDALSTSPVAAPAISRLHVIVPT